MIKRVTQKFYDRAGNLVRITDPLGNNTDTYYDRAGRAVEVHRPPVPTYDNPNKAAESIVISEYDQNGNVVRVTDADWSCHDQCL